MMPAYQTGDKEDKEIDGHFRPETLKDGGGDHEYVRLSISHPSKTGKIRPLSKNESNSAAKSDSPYSGPKRSKRNLLKDITNNLETRSSTLKPSRDFNSRQGAQNKEAKSSFPSGLI